MFFKNDDEQSSMSPFGYQLTESDLKIYSINKFELDDQQRELLISNNYNSSLIKENHFYEE